MKRFRLNYKFDYNYIIYKFKKKLFLIKILQKKYQNLSKSLSFSDDNNVNNKFNNKQCIIY